MGPKLEPCGTLETKSKGNEAESIKESEQNISRKGIPVTYVFIHTRNDYFVNIYVITIFKPGHVYLSGSSWI